MEMTSGRGRGVFATQFIAKGTLIEDAPVIIVPSAQLEKIKSTILFEYYFQWKIDGEDACAICLGFGSLYNHSSHSANARYIRLYAENKIRFVAIKDIPAGHEILTNYNGDADCRRPLWFEESLPASLRKAEHRAS